MAKDRKLNSGGISIYRLNAMLLLIILTSVILYFGKPFIVPLFFSFLFAMLLLPLSKKLERWGFGRVLSTLAGVLVIILFLVLIIGIIAAQGAALANDLTQIQQKADEFLNAAQQWVQSRFGFAPGEQVRYLKKGIKNLSQSGGSMAGSFFSYLSGFLSGLVLVLLYFFFVMWKREKYTAFILKLVRDDNRETIRIELQQIRKVAGQYLVGRLISMLFLAVIYSIGFSITGLPNALLLALIAVVPTIVPYIGAFVGGFFPIVMALLTGSTDMIWPIAIILVVAQVIDNNIIEPLVEGQSLDISPLFTIISLAFGELVWGLPGLILFMPLFAILKIICDHIPSLHPYAFLLANEVPEPKWVKGLKRFIKRK